MKIKNHTTSQGKTTIIIAVIGMLLLSFIILYHSGKKDISQIVQEDNDGSYEHPTVIAANRINYANLIDSKEGLLYQSSEVSIYVVTNVGIPKLVYLYPDNVEGRKETDNFFLHIYLKGNSLLKASSNYVNLDFSQKPQRVVLDGKEYFSFIRDLKSDDYSHPFVHLDSIKHINTGRFRPKKGRSLDIKNVQIPESIPTFNTGVPTATITVKQKDFEKIKIKRADALKRGVLISSDEDLVPGKIAIGNQEPTKINFRLKGDWPDHLRDDKKWSFRIINKGEETVRGMRKFSIQNPQARGLLWEWLFNKVIKDQGLIGLRYDFVNLNIVVESGSNQEVIEAGLMAWEEAFDKILIENNKKREGLILAFDESLYWSDQEREKYLNLSHKTYSRELRDVTSAQIKVFNQSKVLADPGLNKQLTIATEMLEGLRKGDYKLSDVFDLDKLTTFVALTNLFGGSHGLVWHNIRIYYNPITSKFEPVSFDSNSGTHIDKIHHYPFYTQNDEAYNKALTRKLKWVSDASFINSFMSKHHDELNALKLSFITEYAIPINETKLEYNSNFIKKHLNPGTLITANLASYTEGAVEITVTNLTKHPVTINALQHEDGRVLNAGSFKSIVMPQGSSQKVTFPLNDYFVNAFVSKKNKKGSFQLNKDYKKLQISHYINEVEIPRLSEIHPLPKSPDYKKSMALYKKSSLPNFDKFPFITDQEGTLLFKKGKHTLSENLVIPSNVTVRAEKGFSLDLINGASIISKAALILIGTKDEPITFYSSDDTGGGLFITNTSQISELTHCVFNNLSNPQSVIWSVSGAVNFHESEVAISNTLFKNNRCEDGLNIIRSTFTMTDTRFEGTQSDAFDGDFVTGTIERCTFLNSGNDSIDVSGSELVLNDITITNPLDKGISAGEHSSIRGKSIQIYGGEIGVVSKDLSTINLTNVGISGTRLGLSAFQKKTEYGVASIDITSLNLTDVEVAHLIEVDSRLTIDTEAVKTVSQNVIDKMYGKEYGKSSK